MNGTTKRPPEAWYCPSLFESGGGIVVVSRFKSANTVVEAGVFMLDIYCLGVKNAFPSRLSLSDYEERLLADLRRRYGLEAMAPACARKLIEGAVGYAMRLGFAPHHDYKQACWVFGGINAADCPREFVCGRDGKPFYIRGPNETEEQARRIVEHLHRRCGAGGYDYLVALGEADDISRAWTD